MEHNLQTSKSKVENAEISVEEVSNPEGISKKHLGENIRQIRIMLRMNQETLAESAGYSLQMISDLEDKAIIDEENLARIAAALKVPVELIENLDIKGVVYNIQNNHTESKGYFLNNTIPHYNTTTTNSVEVVKLAIESNQKINDMIIKNKDAEIRELKAELKQYMTKR